MAITNVTYTIKVYGVSEKNGYVYCTVEYEINLDKVPGIDMLRHTEEFEDLINSLIYLNDVKCYDKTYDGFESTNGVLSFKAEGMAKCSPDDKFDEELGKKIALTRAQAEAFNTASEVYFEFVRIVENYMYGIANLAYNSKATEYNCKSHVIDLYRNKNNK